VKAAEAARLQERAAEHQSEAATSREQVQEHWDHAESLDPQSRTEAENSGDGPAPDRDAARGEEQNQTADTANYRGQQ
jgi:hypothetical protein